MKYAAEMDFGATIYILFHKDWFRHSKVDRGDTDTYIHTQQGDLISPLLFFSK
jgi:hypothetical protein